MNRKIRKLFENGSVSVDGERGSGKDMLFANIAVRRKAHVSNVPYGKGHIPLDFDKLDVHNDYNTLVTGNISPYEYPYPEGVDIFISDCGIYFPSQYTSNLDKKYPRLPVFLGLSRQLGNVNVHTNTQRLGRVWNKLREQSETYVHCKWCKVFLGIVIQRVVIYEYPDSCERRVKPFVLPRPSVFASRETKDRYLIERERYYQTYGKVTPVLLIYRNRSNYDTRYFKTLLKGDSDET